MRLSRLAVKALMVVAVWSIAHSASVYAYAHFCSPLTPLGFLVTPFLIGSPHCVALRWMINNGALGVSSGWVSFGVLLVGASAAS